MGGCFSIVLEKWITELTLIHKNIRSVCNSHAQELILILEIIGQCDDKHILTSQLKTRWSTIYTWDYTGEVTDPSPSWNWPMVLSWRTSGGTREEGKAIYICSCIYSPEGCVGGFESDLRFVYLLWCVFHRLVYPMLPVLWIVHCW
jgi:hypothetical protein